MEPTTPAAPIEEFPNDFSPQHATLEYIKHIRELDGMRRDPAVLNQRLGELRRAIVSSAQCNCKETSTSTRLGPTSCHWSHDGPHPFAGNMTYGSCEDVEGLPFNGRWPFMPTAREFLILQAELSLKGMALARDIFTDPTPAQSSDPMECTFTVISRSSKQRQRHERILRGAGVSLVPFCHSRFTDDWVCIA